MNENNEASNDVNVLAPPPTLKTQLERIERELILKALEKNNGRATKTAKLLGLSRKTLWARLKKFGLRRSDGLSQKRLPL